MAGNTPNSDQTEEKGVPTGSSSILDRKIERRALPASFSSNLVRRGMGSGRSTADRSVRSIVTLFENSAATSQSPTSSGPVVATRKAGGGGKDDQETAQKSTKPAPNSHQAPEKEQSLPSRKITPISHSPQTEYQVEDYSLTLLGHKSYFNNRPLARCLDEKLENNTETKIRRIEVNEEGGEVANDGESGKHGAGHEPEVNKGPLSQQQVVSTPVKHPESTTGGLTLQGTTEPTTILELKRRDLQEVADFWDYVRKQLWIDDEEIYGEGHKKVETLKNTVAPEGEETEGFILDPMTPTCGPPGFYRLSSGPESFLPSPERLPPPAPSLGLAGSEPKYLDPDYFLYHEPELSGLPPVRRPLPTPPIAPNHSRNPSSGGSGSGRWVRPPMWRTPSSTHHSPAIQLSPALPSPVPTPMGGSFADYPPSSARINHRRNRHQPHISRSNASETSFSASICSTAGTQGSEHSRGHSRGQSSHQYPPQTPHYGHDHHGSQTSSAATRSTRADSAMGLSTASTGLAEMEDELAESMEYQPNTPRRRMTAEEKLSEIDEFLSPSPDETERQMGGWI